MGKTARDILELARFSRWCGLGFDDGEDLSAVSDRFGVNCGG